MKKIALIALSGLFLISCGGKEEKKDGFQMNRAKEETVAKKETAGVDLSNKGIGPVTSVSLGAIDDALVAKGKDLFDTNCMSCHMADQRLIGPAMKGLLDKRAPEWIMNMILNPNEMLSKDPIAKALFKEYNNAIMLDTNMSEENARALLEYIRSL